MNKKAISVRKTTRTPKQPEPGNNRLPLQHRAPVPIDLVEADGAPEQRVEDLQPDSRFRRLVENSSDIIYEVNAGGVITYVSPAILPILGYSPDQVVGHQFTGLMHPEEHERIARDIEHILSGRKIIDDYRLLSATRKVVWVRNTSMPVVRDRRIEGFQGSLSDITERRYVEEFQRFTQFSVDQVGDAAYWMGADARFVYVNMAACRVLGYSSEELLTMTVHDIDPNFPREVWPDHWRELREKGTMTVESVHRTKAGELIPVEITTNFIEFEGHEYNCAFAKDIRERVRAEKERKNLEEQMQHAQKLESLGVLAGGIAHDFNNLLMAILGNTEMAMKAVSESSPARRSLVEIEKASMRAAELCKQMLAYSGRSVFEMHSLDISGLIGDITHMLEVSISKKTSLKCDFEDDLPPIKGDSAQIGQVIMNLVINASEAIGADTGVISVTTGTRECDRSYLEKGRIVEALTEGTYVYAEVEDTGCGMDAETQEKLFDPFFTTKFTGRGLGLSAVLGIMRGHKGTIMVSSTPGEGSTVTVLFPVAENLRSNNIEVVLLDKKPKPSGKTILVVEDEERIRTLCERMLKELSFTVLTASNGKEAMTVFKEHADDISCVLLDLTMPEMDGEETFYALRNIRDDLPVILSSGYSEQDVTERFAGRGPDAFIQKPYRSLVLSEKIDQALRGHR